MSTSAPTRSFDSVEVGQELPALSIPLSVTGIVATAIATRDYQPVHHDLERARSLGNAHVFMSTHTTAGYLERFVLEWGGRDVLLRKVAFRLGVPNYAGDTMAITGKVVGKDPRERTVDIEAVGRNSLGEHVVGTIVVKLP